MPNESLPKHLISLNLISLEMWVAVQVNVDGLGTPIESNAMVLGRVGGKT